VLAKNEYAITSLYSEITEYIAAALPSKITFPPQPFSTVTLNSLELNWNTPIIDSATMIPINYYKVYWDEGYRNSGDFVLYSFVTSYDQDFFTVSNLETGKLYKFQISAVNDVGEGLLSDEISHYAMTKPSAPQTPYIITSIKTGTDTSSATIGWYAVIETGGVPLTGYKLYAKLLATGVETLVYDGTDKPEILSTVVENLVLNQDYDMYLTALNIYEGPKSLPVRVRAAGLPQAPGPILLISDSRTGTSIGLEWTPPASDGGSPILAYNLVMVTENQADKVIYYGTSLSTKVAGLQSGELYRFRVQCTNVVGKGPWSSIY